MKQLSQLRGAKSYADELSVCRLRLPAKGPMVAFQGGATPMSHELDTARRYRDHAERLRAIAAQDEHHPNKEILIAVAQDYERMAEAMETIASQRQESNRRH